MKTVWLGSGGNAVGYGFARAIRRRWGPNVRIVSADINPPHLVATSLFADVCLQVPRVGHDEFRDVLLCGLREHRVTTYIPVLDEEIVLAAELREEGVLPPEEVEIVAPTCEAASVCFDKWMSARWLLVRHINTPVTALPRDARWNGHGAVVKPRHGRGSLNVSVVLTEEEWEWQRETLSDDYVLQDVCDGPEITIDIFSSRHGYFVASCRERLETKAGVCTKARVFRDRELRDIAFRVASLLPLPYGSCIQLMYDRSRMAWLVTDINPRLGAGTAMSAAAGQDFFSAVLAEAFGEDPGPFFTPVDEDHYVVRQYEEFVTE